MMCMKMLEETGLTTRFIYEVHLLMQILYYPFRTHGGASLDWVK